MATILQIKRTTTSNLPSTQEQGELLYIYDTGGSQSGQGQNGQRLYIGDPSVNTNTPYVVGGKYFTDMLDHAHGTLTASSGVIVDSNSKIDVWNVDNITIDGNTISSTDVGGNIVLSPNGAGTVRTDNLQFDGNTISSTNVDGDLVLDPNGIGNVLLGNFEFDVDQTVGAGQDNYVLTYDNGTGHISLEASATGGHTIQDAGVAETQRTNLNFNTGFDVTDDSGNDATVVDIDTAVVVTLTGSQTLTNKTLTSPVLTTPQINDTSADHQYIFAVSELTLDRTVTLPLLTGDDTFVFEAHTQTLTNKTLTSPVLNTGVSGTAVLDDDTFTTATATTLATSESIKAYVDAQVTASDLDFLGDTGGAQSVDLDSQSLTITGGTGIDTVGSAQTLTINIDSTVATLTGSQTLTNKTLTSPVITTPQINDTSADHQYIFAVSELTLDRTVTLPLLTGDDTFVFEAHSQTLTNKTISGASNTLTNIGNGSLTNSTITVTGDTGSQAIDLGDTLTVTGGTGIDTTVSGDTITIAGVDATSAVKGIASFDATDFTVTSGAVAVNTITLGTSSLDPGATTLTLAGLQQLTVDDIDVNGNTISSTQTDQNVIIDPNGTGALDVNTSRIINVLDPTGDQDAATKAYVDALVQGLDIKNSTRVATTGALSANYANGTAGVGATLTATGNGAISIDSISLSQNDRVLVKDQGNDAHNGIYYVSTVGDVGNPYVLTRATDADEPDELTGGSFVFVEEGSNNADNGYVFTHNGQPTFGTTNLTVSQFSGAGQITAGAGLTKTGNTLNVGAGTGITVNADDVQISATYAGQTSIVTLGTITTGTWNGTAIDEAYGGTGITTYTTGDILYASAANTLSKLALGADGKVLQSNGSNVVYGDIDGGTY